MSEDVELYGRIIQDRDMSVLYEDGGCPELRVWLPKSLIAVVHQPGGAVKVTMPEWLAKKKGLY
jgi:hypothetical protein